MTQACRAGGAPPRLRLPRRLPPRFLRRGPAVSRHRYPPRCRRCLLRGLAAVKPGAQGRSPAEAAPLPAQPSVKAPRAPKPAAAPAAAAVPPQAPAAKPSAPKPVGPKRAVERATGSPAFQMTESPSSYVVTLRRSWRLELPPTLEPFELVELKATPGAAVALGQVIGRARSLSSEDADAWGDPGELCGDRLAHGSRDGGSGAAGRPVVPGGARHRLHHRRPASTSSGARRPRARPSAVRVRSTRASPRSPSTSSTAASSCGRTPATSSLPSRALTCCVCSPTVGRPGSTRRVAECSCGRAPTRCSPTRCEAGSRADSADRTGAVGCRVPPLSLVAAPSDSTPAPGRG